MPSININGIDLYYEVHGEGPPVLMAHGVGSNHLHWWQQIPSLSKRHKLITFDHRGFGFSSEDGKGPPAFVEDVRCLLEHLAIDRVALVGQSMGGITLTGFASRFPERVTALVLSCSGGGVIPASHSPAMKGALAESKDYLEFSRRSLDQDGFRDRQPELYVLFEAMAQLNRNVQLAQLAKMRTLKHDAAPIAAAGIPTLLIGGEDDNGVNEAMAGLNRLIPSSRFIILPEVGHLLFFEGAQAYNALVGSFLAEHLPRSRRTQS